MTWLQKKHCETTNAMCFFLYRWPFYWKFALWKMIFGILVQLTLYDSNYFSCLGSVCGCRCWIFFGFAFEIIWSLLQLYWMNNEIEYFHGIRLVLLILMMIGCGNVVYLPTKHKQIKIWSFNLIMLQSFRMGFSIFFVTWNATHEPILRLSISI